MLTISRSAFITCPAGATSPVLPLQHKFLRFKSAEESDHRPPTVGSRRLIRVSYTAGLEVMTRDRILHCDNIMFMFLKCLACLISLLVLRQVPFCRWEGGPCEGNTFPRPPKLPSLLAQGPSIAQPVCCVCSPFMERIPPNGFKRLSQREKNVPEAW